MAKQREARREQRHAAAAARVRRRRERRERRAANRQYRRQNPGWWRRWWRRLAGRRKKSATPGQPATGAGQRPARVGDQARRPPDADQAAAGRRKPAPPPVHRRTTDPSTQPQTRTPAAAAAAAPGGTVSNASAMKVLLGLAEEMNRVAATFERPDGVMDLIDREYRLLPDVLEELTRAWTAVHRRATDPIEGDPLPPAVMDLLDQIAKTQHAAAAAAADVAPLARRLEQARIDALSDPRNRKWDHRANPGHAA